MTVFDTNLNHFNTNLIPNSGHFGEFIYNLIIL